MPPSQLYNTPFTPRHVDTDSHNTKPAYIRKACEIFIGIQAGSGSNSEWTVLCHGTQVCRLHFTLPTHPDKKTIARPQWMPVTDCRCDQSNRTRWQCDDGGEHRLLVHRWLSKFVAVIAAERSVSRRSLLALLLLESFVELNSLSYNTSAAAVHPITFTSLQALLLKWSFFLLLDSSWLLRCFPYTIQMISSMAFFPHSLWDFAVRNRGHDLGFYLCSSQQVETVEQLHI